MLQYFLNKVFNEKKVTLTHLKASASFDDHHQGRTQFKVCGINPGQCYGTALGILYCQRGIL